jgi:hypothetical protein
MIGWFGISPSMIYVKLQMYFSPPRLIADQSFPIFLIYFLLIRKTGIAIKEIMRLSVAKKMLKIRDLKKISI